jgi:hypothetical protein
MITAVSDWDQFLADVPWFLRAGQTVHLGYPQSWTRPPVDALPELSALLAEATLTPVSVDSEQFELLAWGPLHKRRGWLCHPARPGTDDAVPPIHKTFWTMCGGIVERFSEPEGWWLNQNEILTASATRVPIGEVLDDYAWMWRDDGQDIPIDPDDWYVVAVEANGNLTLADRRDGRLLLFAPDHSFDGVTPLAGCPPYSLLTIDALPDLRTWIEENAAAWRDQ